MLLLLAKFPRQKLKMYVSIVVSLFVKGLEEQRNNYSCLLLHVQLFPGADVITHYNCLSQPYNALSFQGKY